MTERQPGVTPTRRRGGEMNFYLAVLASARALLVKTPDDRPSIVAPQNAPDASAR